MAQPLPRAAKGPKAVTPKGKLDLSSYTNTHAPAEPAGSRGNGGSGGSGKARGSGGSAGDPVGSAGNEPGFREDAGDSGETQVSDGHEEVQQPPKRIYYDVL